MLRGDKYRQSRLSFKKMVGFTDRQESVVSNWRKNVVTKLGEKVSFHFDQPSTLIGSYDRDTITKYLSEGDVDVMVVLHYGDNKNWENKEGVTKALHRFKEILQDAYPETECSVDKNCVTMKLTEFRLDVVPAFDLRKVTVASLIHTGENGERPILSDSLSHRQIARVLEA